MSGRALVVTFVVYLAFPPVAGTPWHRVNAAEDPPQYEQLVKDLGSTDAAVRKAAAEKLATAEAIPALVQAVGGPDDNVSSRAADLLFTLMDSDKPEVASQADAAVTQLEQSSNETVAQLMAGTLERRQESTLQILRDLRASVSPSRLGGRSEGRSMVRIHYGWKGGDEGFKYLRRLRGPLTLEVTLEDEPATIDRGWGGPSSGRRRVAEGIPITTVQGLVSLHDLRNLESVSLTMFGTHDDLVRLADLPQLKNLSLIFPDESTGTELAEVARLSQLEQLKLFQAPDLKEHLEALAALQNLKSLAVAYSGRATSSGLAHLPRLVQLEALRVANTPDLGIQLPDLAAWPTLRQLHLVGRRVTDADLAHVGKLATLEELMLQDTSVTDDGYARLQGLTQLRRLLLPWSTITDDAIPHLQRLSALERLNAFGSFLSVVGATKLHHYQPNLTIDGELIDPPPTAEHRQSVRQLIRLGGGVWAGDDSPSKDPRKQCRTRALLSDSWRGSEADLQLLTKLEGLEVLDVKTGLTDSAADQLRHLVELQTIILRDTQMTDQGLGFLGSLPNLKTVLLVGPFTDAASPVLVAHHCRTRAGQADADQ